MKILVLDNYDSFTYNLVHIVRELGYGDGMDIFRNDKIALDEIGRYDKVLLSPGPGIPTEAGIMQALIRRYAAEKSILGICLGHQGIGEVFGATLFNMPEVLHGVGKQIQVTDPEEYLFRGIPQRFTGCRYHSWALDGATINGEIHITAMDEDGVVMGIAHREYDVRGLQFHPESILTEHGIALMRNWLEHTATDTLSS
jgi:anthranilate synthase component II